MWLTQKHPFSMSTIKGAVAVCVGTEDDIKITPQDKDNTQNASFN